MRAELERPIFDGAFWSSILHSRTFWVPQDHGALLGTFAIAMMLLASLLLLRGFPPAGAGYRSCTATSPAARR